MVPEHFKSFVLCLLYILNDPMSSPLFGNHSLCSTSEEIYNLQSRISDDFIVLIP
jgi:hypothetical protein